MNQIVNFIRKETRHIMRDKLTLLIMLVLPLILLLILGFAVSNEVKNTPFVVLDDSKSTASQKLIAKITENSYFAFVYSVNSFNDVESSFQKGDCKVAIIIPSSFGNDLLATGIADIQFMIDASNPNEASTIENYLQMLVLDYQQEMTNSEFVPPINMEIKMLYNPQMESSYSFVPGLIGLIMMLICAIMTSASIVKEKELGTMEILLVSPVKPIVVIFSKAVPYLVVALSNVVTILVVSHYALNLPIAGNIFLIMVISILFTFSALSLGLFISSITETQQAAMNVSLVGLLLPSMLLSGVLFPVDSMPTPLQWLSTIVPARWFIVALKDVMIKGEGFLSVWSDMLILLVMSIVFIFISVKKFKDRL